MIADANGQVVSRYDFLPFGEAWEPPQNPDLRQFAGKERDAGSGFDYFVARYYASGNGRFATVDPVLDVDKAVADRNCSTDTPTLPTIRLDSRVVLSPTPFSKPNGCGLGLGPG